MVWTATARHTLTVGILACLCRPAHTFAEPPSAAVSGVKPVLAGAPAPVCLGLPVYRWLLANAASCPAAGNGWAVSQPFADASNWLNAVCTYDWLGQDPPARATLPNASGLVPDCQAVPVAKLVVDREDDPGLPAEAYPALRGAFLAALDAPQWTPGALRSLGTSELTRLAILDAKPLRSTKPLRGSVQHGNYAEGLMRELGCVGRSCAFEPASYHALYPSGLEVVGSAFDSALQAYRALRDHQAGTAPHLLLSLGLGFDLDQGCSLSANGLSVSVLRTVLSLAACEADALIVAPVGNTRVLQTATGPMYPAAWADFDVQCEHGGPQRPLVTAVSGVDELLAPLASSRAHARFMLAANHAVVTDPVSLSLTAPRSGSSIAAAGGAAAFALAWSLRPELSSSELLALLDGAKTATQPAIAGSGVLHICSTLQALCAGQTSERCQVVGPICTGGTPLSAAVPLPKLLQEETGLAKLQLRTIARAGVKPAAEAPSCNGHGQRGGGTGPDEYTVTVWNGGGQVWGPALPNDQAQTLKLMFGHYAQYTTVSSSGSFSLGALNVDDLAGAYWWYGATQYPANLLLY